MGMEIDYLNVLVKEQVALVITFSQKDARQVPDSAHNMTRQFGLLTGSPAFNDPSVYYDNSSVYFLPTACTWSSRMLFQYFRVKTYYKCSYPGKYGRTYNL